MLSTHTLEHVAAETRPTCPLEATITDGDAALTLAGPIAAAAPRRSARREVGRSSEVQLGRAADDLLHRLRARLVTVAEERLRAS